MKEFIGNRGVREIIKLTHSELDKKIDESQIQEVSAETVQEMFESSLPANPPDNFKVIGDITAGGKITSNGVAVALSTDIESLRDSIALEMSSQVDLTDIGIYRISQMDITGKRTLIRAAMAEGEASIGSFNKLRCTLFANNYIVGLSNVYSLDGNEYSAFTVLPSSAFHMNRESNYTVLMMQFHFDPSYKLWPFSVPAVVVHNQSKIIGTAVAYFFPDLKDGAGYIGVHITQTCDDMSIAVDDQITTYINAPYATQFS